MIRYIPKESPDGTWHVYDAIRQSPVMTARDQDDATRDAAFHNELDERGGQYPDGFLFPVLASIPPEDRAHYDGVHAKDVADAKDKYDLAHQLGDYIQHSSDRLQAERIYRIQLWWEAVQRANGFEPIERIYRPGP